MLNAQAWGLIGGGLVNTGLIIAVVRLWGQNVRTEQKALDLERRVGRLENGRDVRK